MADYRSVNDPTCSRDCVPGSVFGLRLRGQF